MTREVETQFILELPRAYRWVVEQHGQRVLAAIGAAMSVLFGLPIDTPTNVRVRYTDRYQLLEANGHILREPAPLEVQGAMIGAMAALFAMLELHVHSVDLRGERVTDA